MRDQVITDPDEWLESAEKAQRLRDRARADRGWAYRAYWSALIADVGNTMVSLGIFEKPSRSFYLNVVGTDDIQGGYEYSAFVSDWWHLKNEGRRYLVNMNLAPGEKSIMWDLVDRKGGRVLYSGVTACLEVLGK